MNKVNKAVFNANAQCCNIMNHLIKEKTMEKTNVVELLKDCPQGMELDCYMFNGLEFDHINTDNENYPIVCRAKTLSGEYNMHTFTKYGWYTYSYDYSKCVIFPKGKTTWEGFVPPYQFKNGDILYIDCTKESDNEQYEYIFILDGIYNGEIHSYCHYHMCDGIHLRTVYLADNKHPIRFATKEEKEKLFDAIKANGYKWNAETKTLEKLIPNKFDITTLVPFESRVLARDNEREKWYPGIWGYYDNDTASTYPYKIIGGIARYCIPYEGNEHLLGKTNDCDEHFKTWK